jgi:hypothetical protein
VKDQEFGPGLRKGEPTGTRRQEGPIAIHPDGDRVGLVRPCASRSIRHDVACPLGGFRERDDGLFVDDRQMD